RWMQLAFFVRRLQGYIELIDKLHISPAFLRYIEKIPNLRMFKNNQGTKRRRCGRESVQKCKRGIIRWLRNTGHIQQPNFMFYFVPNVLYLLMNIHLLIGGVL